MFEFFWTRVRTYPTLIFQYRRAAKKFGVSSFALWKRAVVMYVRYGLGPRNILARGLVDPRMPPDVEATCISFRRVSQRQRRISPPQWRCLMQDKAVFHAFCSASELPVPKLYAVFDKSGGWTGTGDVVADRAAWERFFENDLPQEFIVKPALRGRGVGITLYRRVGAAFADSQGETFSASSLYEHLQNDPRDTRFVIQECVFNHPAIDQLTANRALQTARITTWITQNGDLEHCVTFFKLIVGENLTDNFLSGSTGNLVANIDLETGAIAAAIGPSPDKIGFNVVPNHPVTGLALNGVVLPHWPSAMALTARAARLFLPLRTLGWDVALTPDGPVLIEANAWWESLSELAAAPHVNDSRRADLARIMQRFFRETSARSPAVR